MPRGCLSAALRLLLAIDSRETAIDGVAEPFGFLARLIAGTQGRWHIVQGPASYEEALELTSGMPQGLLESQATGKARLPTAAVSLSLIMGMHTSSWSLSSAMNVLSLRFMWRVLALLIR